MSKVLVRNNRGFDEGGYFFFVISITSAIMETIRVSNKNNSLYVIISTALLSGGKSALRIKRTNRLPFKVCLIPNGIITYIDNIRKSDVFVLLLIHFLIQMHFIELRFEGLSAVKGAVFAVMVEHKTTLFHNSA